MLRRRRREADQEPEGQGVPGDVEDDLADDEATGVQDSPGQGPWDIEDDVPAVERIDFGSLQVPVGEGFEVQVGMAEDQAAWVTVVRGESSLQVQAFAAPRGDGLWDDVRAEIVEEIAKAGGTATESDGPFGPELHARVASPPMAPGTRPGPAQPVRFLGVDGPRWFLRGVISGPAASRRELAAPLEQAFAGVVVARGSHPVPPRDLLEIRLPTEVRQALAEQMGTPPGEQQAEEQASRWVMPAPQRGPETTETR